MASAIPKDQTSRQRPRSISPPLTFSHTRIVLVGKTGAGKSSCANTILGRDAFKSAVSGSSVTRECTKETGEVGDRKVTIVDTPGLFDTSSSDEKVKREIAKCVNMSCPGPHAILVVVQVGTFTKEEKDAVKKVEEIFGKDAEKHTMILFTHGDEVKGDFNDCLREAGENLKQILGSCGRRFHIFNNVKTNDRTQVCELFEKIDNMVALNKGAHYSNYTYLEVVKILDERESELVTYYEKRVRKDVEELESEYQKAVAALSKENLALRQTEKRLKKKRDTSIRETERYYTHLMKETRHVVERVPRSESFDNVVWKYTETLQLD